MVTFVTASDIMNINALSMVDQAEREERLKANEERKAKVAQTKRAEAEARRQAPPGSGPPALSSANAAAGPPGLTTLPSVMSNGPGQIPQLLSAGSGPRPPFSNAPRILPDGVSHSLPIPSGSGAPANGAAGPVRGPPPGFAATDRRPPPNGARPGSTPGAGEGDEAGPRLPNGLMPPPGLLPASGPPGLDGSASSSPHVPYTDVRQLESNVRHNADESVAPKVDLRALFQQGMQKQPSLLPPGPITASSDIGHRGLPNGVHVNGGGDGRRLAEGLTHAGLPGVAPITSKGSGRSGKNRPKSSGKGQGPASGVAADAAPAGGGGAGDAQWPATPASPHNAPVVIVRPPRRDAGAAASAAPQPVSGLPQTGGVSTGGEGHPHVSGTTGVYIPGVGGAEADGRGSSMSRSSRGKGRGGRPQAQPVA
jgi:hypothetical protein